MGADGTWVSSTLRGREEGQGGRRQGDGEGRKERVRRKVGGEKEENPNSQYWFSRESGNLPSTDKGVKKMGFSYITEYHAALKKRMKTCHLKQHGWTWRALC